MLVYVLSWIPQRAVESMAARPRQAAPVPDLTMTKLLHGDQ